MSGLFNSGDPTGGLMGIFANPQTAGLLGMAGGLLSAAGPSRLPVTNGQAFGLGLQGLQQGAQQGFSLNRQMMMYKALQDALGNGSTPSPSPQAPMPYTAVTGAADTGPMMGVGAGMGSYGPQQAGVDSANAQQDQQFAQQQAQWNAQNGPMAQYQRQLKIFPFLGIPTSGVEAQMKYDPALARMMPTDIQKNAAAAYGFDSPEYTNAIRGVVDKEGIVALRPGAPYIRGGQVYGTPGQAPAGYMNVPNGDGTWSVQSVAGGPEAVKGSAAAGAIGKAYGTNTTGYQNGKPVFVNQGQLSDQLTNGGPGSGVPGFTPFQNAVRMVESQGNPAAVNPASGAVGTMQTMPSTATNPGFGVRPAANNSPAELQRVGADYAAAMQNRYGNDTDAAVAYNWGPANADRWIQAGRPWKMLPTETQSYVGQVHAAMQNFNGGQGGASASVSPELPPGSKNAANTSQGAPSQQMTDMQNHLADSDNTYQASRQALQKMISITQNGGIGDTVVRMLPEGVGTRISDNAAEYQKAHANYVSLQGKALGSGGTDASRATLDEAVPTFDKPQAAKLSGLNDQLNQLDWNHLKRQALNPIFQQGNEKAYTQQSAAFDNAIQPSMMPQITSLLSMPTGAARTASLQKAIGDPKMKAALDLMVQTGQLK